MWGQIAGAALGGLLSGKGGGGTQTVNRDPWAPAQDWLKGLLSQGQDLQRYYQASPFNNIQQAAYSNLLGGGDYINAAVPSLLAQMNNFRGFDRSNPNARPMPFQMPAMGQGGVGRTTQMQGLLGNMNTAQNPYANGLMPMPPQQQPTQYGPTDPWWTMVLDNQSGGTGA